MSFRFLLCLAVVAAGCAALFARWLSPCGTQDCPSTSIAPDAVPRYAKAFSGGAGEGRAALPDAGGIDCATPPAILPLVPDVGCLGLGPLTLGMSFDKLQLLLQELKTVVELGAAGASPGDAPARGALTVLIPIRTRVSPCGSCSRLAVDPRSLMIEGFSGKQIIMNGRS